MAEYDGNEDLLCWRIGTFGHKTKDGSTISSYYYIKDHLGNIRVTVKDDGAIVTKDDYYPFGLRMGGMSYNAGNANDRLKYSSKELDEGMGLSPSTTSAGGIIIRSWAGGLLWIRQDNM